MILRKFSGKHLQKRTHIFVIYTIITFLIGVVLKIILIGNLHDNHANFLPNHVDLYKRLKLLSDTQLWNDHHHLTRATVESALNTFQRAESVNLSGLILQWFLFVTTLIVYIKTFFEFKKMYFNKKSLTTIEWMKIRNEYWIFFVLFLVIDIASIGIVFSFTTNIKGWVAYTLATTTIIPVFIAGSLLLVYKMKREVIKTTIFLTPAPWIRLFSKKARTIIVPYENVKTNKAIKWLKWSLAEEIEK